MASKNENKCKTPHYFPNLAGNVNNTGNKEFDQNIHFFVMKM